MRRVVVGIIVLGFPVGLAWTFNRSVNVVLGSMAANGSLRPGLLPFLPVLSAVPPLVLLAVATWQMRRLGKRHAWRSRESAGGDITAALVAAIVGLVVIVSAGRALASLGMDLVPRSGFTVVQWVYYSTLGALFPAIGEEAYFRSYVGAVFRGRVHDIAVIAASGLAFAAWHVNTPAYMLHTAVLGAIWMGLYLRRGSLFPVVLSHAVLNVAVGPLIYFGLI